jgi:hypothetical protein
MKAPSIIRAGALSAFVGAFILFVQFVIALPLGPNFAQLESSLDANLVSTFVRDNARAMQWLMAADDAFVISYTIAFAGIAAFILPRSRLLALLGLGFALLTSASDFTENSLTLAITTLTLQQLPLDLNWLLVLNILGQLKWLWIFVGVTLFAVGIWGERRLNRIVSVLFLIFPLLGVLALVSVEAGLLRVLWMFALLVAGGLLLWREAVETH